MVSMNWVKARARKSMLSGEGASPTTLQIDGITYANIVLLPSCSQNKRNPRKEGLCRPLVEWPSIKAMVEGLKSDNAEIAISAAKSLIGAGRRALPELLSLLDGRNRRLSKRALFVLHNIDWSKVDERRKSIAIVKLCFQLFRFEEGGKRAPESLISESILQKIGPAAFPLFVALLQSPKPIARMLGLSALLDMEWSAGLHQNTPMIEKVLEEIKDDRVPVFRLAAQVILERIRGSCQPFWNRTLIGLDYMEGGYAKAA